MTVDEARARRRGDQRRFLRGVEAGGGGSSRSKPWRSRQESASISTRSVLGEAVDERDDAGGSGEDGAPLLEGKVGGDHRRAALVPAADDVVQDVGGARVAWQVAELIQDQNLGPGIALEPPLEGGHRLLLQKIGERGREGGEAHRVSGGERRVAEVFGEHGLADAGLAAEEHVLAASDEVEADEFIDEDAVDLARMRPVESIERFEFAEIRRTGPAREVGGLACSAFERDQLLDRLGGTDPALVGVREKRR